MIALYTFRNSRGELMFTHSGACCEGMWIVVYHVWVITQCNCIHVIVMVCRTHVYELLCDTDSYKIPGEDRHRHPTNVEV